MKKIFLSLLVLAPIATAAHQPNLPAPGEQYFTSAEPTFSKDNVKWTIECSAKFNGVEKTVAIREYYTAVRYSGQFKNHKRIPGEVKAEWFDDAFRSTAKNRVANVLFQGTGAVARVTLPQGEIGSQMNGKIKVSLNRDPFSRKSTVEEYKESDCKLTEGSALAKK